MKIHFRKGDRVEACMDLTWTLDEFEDSPLVLKKGAIGTLIEIRGHFAYVEWDEDQNKQFRKCLSLLNKEELPIRKRSA
jgi:hypothetical protein